VEGEQLLLIDVVNAHGVVILQTISAPADKLRFGRRLTRSETIKDQAALLDRLVALVSLIAGHLPLVPPPLPLGDNVVLVDMAPPAAVEAAPEPSPDAADPTVAVAA
jgi:hypothetical protein